MVEEENKPYYVVFSATTGSTIATLIAKYLGITDLNVYIFSAGAGSVLGGLISVLFLYYS